VSGAWQISASTGTVLRLNNQLIGFFYKRVKETEDAKELASSTGSTGDGALDGRLRSLPTSRRCQILTLS
jgi:hypothetical protein